ncbi:glycosyltransferase family 1 protein [Pusillimonas sp.]|uniref:glycosyltransferase family 4 protein n=1 Tax=Pusillimonas sp. TaxID=3040095 RepID=UPI0029BA012F|nr:glycosyltransferase family 1 protein [Pusillimonas sp.]MDX3894169.1 glycosyltransferase family 1 protein [Pusillimonas sp.]
MRRIAIISEHASPLAQIGSVDSGGQNVYVAQVARHLGAMGHHVDVFTRLDNPYMPRELEWESNVRIVHVPAGPARVLPKEQLLPHMAEFSDFLRQYFSCQEESYDLVHANFFMSAMAALPVARAAGIPLAVTFHALGRVRRKHQAQADLFPDSRFEIEDNIVREADCIVAECPEDRRDLIELYGADPARICMVPCGYDPDEMSPMDGAEARRALGWNPDAFYVLQLGRMVPRKGVDNVIRGLCRLRALHKIDARLCVVGGDGTDPSNMQSPEMTRLLSVAEEEGVSEAVEFVGRRGRAQLRRFYAAADVFATTPWYEPFGITPVEAMACARPVVGSDTGGIRYTVRDGQTGFLVAPRDPDALASRLAMLARSPELAQRMGRAGERRARSLFTWQRVAGQLDDVFAQLAMGRAPVYAGGRQAGVRLMA